MYIERERERVRERERERESDMVPFRFTFLAQSRAPFLLLMLPSSAAALAPSYHHLAPLFPSTVQHTRDASVGIPLMPKAFSGRDAKNIVSFAKATLKTMT